VPQSRPAEAGEHAQRTGRNVVGISVPTGQTLTFGKGTEMGFSPRQFLLFWTPFTAAGNRRAAPEQFSSLPDVALLARLVR
jgi:hypothetical protein